MVNTETNFIYKPSFFRLILFFVCVPIFLILLGWGTRLIADYFAHDIGDLGRQTHSIMIMISVYAVLNFVFLLINKNQFTVTINPKSFSGPSGVGLASTLKTFPIEKIDTEKLFYKTFWENFWHEKAIWSTNKEKIIISRVYYSKEQEKEILENLLSLSKKYKEI